MRTRPRRSGKKSTPFLLAADGKSLAAAAANNGSGREKHWQRPLPSCRELGERPPSIPPEAPSNLPQLGEVGGGRGAESLFHHLLAENEIVADSDAEISGRANCGSNYTVRILGSAIVCWF